MSKKIVGNIFSFAAQQGAQHLVVSRQAEGMVLDCHFPDGPAKTLSLPKKIEEDFFKSLQRILAIVPGDLINRQYRKIIDGQGHWRYYLSVLPDKNGEKIVISLLNDEERLWRLNQLGLQKADRQSLKSLEKIRSGLVIVSSPPRQGKSSTLYALVDQLNKPELNICALDDDPPGKLTNINFFAAKQANWQKITQHDSDIIVAGDLDEEWALDNAIRAAASGRLVLGSLTADSASEVLNRILKMKIARRLKIEALRLITNQRLVPLRTRRQKTKNAKRGQIGLFEILSLTPEIKSFLTAADEKELTSIKFNKKLEQCLLLSGFRPLEDDRRQKIKDAVI